jgi:hypothetical protein
MNRRSRLRKLHHQETNKVTYTDEWTEEGDISKYKN